MAGKIGIIDVDGHNFPNLALMKISSYYKRIGCKVERVDFGHYDKVFMSKVFTYTDDYVFPLITYDEIVKGGTGYNYDRLPEEIEHIMPDYSLYSLDKAYGFLTRGCPNKCSWCIVPDKEGKITNNADITEFWDNQKEAVLLDNNVLAHDHGLKQIEKIIDLGIKIDFNQGLDIRIIAENPDVAKLLSRVKWSKYIRIACDTKSQIPFIEKGVKLLNDYGLKSYKIFVYVLVKDIPDAYERVIFLKNLKVQPFAQPYRDFNNNIPPSKKQREFARWVNHKAIFKTVDYYDYQ